MNIRILSKDDLYSLIKLYKHLHQVDDESENRGLEHRTWEDIISDKRIRYYGAFVEEALIASCTITLIPNLTRSCRPYGLIENVVCHSDFRRKGYAKNVLKVALKFAWDSNAYKVMLMTGRKNEGTTRLYQSAGFNSDEKQGWVIRS